MNAKDEILLIIAEGETYDSEYDGRTYTYCKYCDHSIEGKVLHDENCLMLRARVALGKVWTDKIEREQREREEAEQRERQQREKERQRRAIIAANDRARYLANCVECQHCHKQIDKDNLVHHQRNSHKCLEAQGKRKSKQENKSVLLASVSTNKLVVGTKTGQRCCPNCGKDLTGAHPNKKFCSNKGEGNCKDAHHNKHNPRGIGGAMQALREIRREMLEEESEDDEFEHGHIFASGMDGHGQE